PMWIIIWTILRSACERNIICSLAVFRAVDTLIFSSAADPAWLTSEISRILLVSSGRKRSTPPNSVHKRLV
ncbi:MAG: hypothetical protein ACRDIE_25470, partial [Chloroflexota bacterium]